jgi:protein SCO1/2
MRARNLALSLGLASLVFAMPAAAHDGHHHHQRPDPAAAPVRAPQSAAINLHDVTLRDQTGAPVRFRSDVVGDRIVVVDFIYTSCTTVCPVVSALFAEIQEKLGERLGREVLLLSLSIDPVTDSPARLREYAARFESKPGWIWLTGDKADMERVLRGLGTYTPNFTQHPQQVLVGDGRRGIWTRFYGTPDPARILARIDELAAGPQAASAPALEN